jgi:hypothetical protein
MNEQKPQWRVVAEKMAAAKVEPQPSDGMSNSEKWQVQARRADQYYDELGRLARDYEENGARSEVALYMSQQV